MNFALTSDVPVNFSLYIISLFSNRMFNFTIVQQGMNWTEARDACTTLGARLVQPENPEKNEHIKKALRSKSARNHYFGASRYPNGDLNLPVTDQWTYTTGALVNFNNWGPGEGGLISQQMNKN